MRTKGVKLTTCTKRKHALLIGSYYRNLRLKICNHLTNQCLKNSSQININKTVKYFWEISTLVISTGPWTMGCSRESKINHTGILRNLVSLLNCYGVGHVNTLPTYYVLIGLYIYLLIISHPTLIEKVFTCPPIGMSDHDILAIQTTLEPSMSTKINRTVSNHKNANWNEVKSNMSDLCENHQWRKTGIPSRM